MKTYIIKQYKDRGDAALGDLLCDSYYDTEASQGEYDVYEDRIEDDAAPIFEHRLNTDPVIAEWEEVEDAGRWPAPV